MLRQLCTTGLLFVLASAAPCVPCAPVAPSAASSPSPPTSPFDSPEAETAPSDVPAHPAAALALADAPEVERQSLQRLLESPSWPRRALAALRLERYRDEASQATLEKLLIDPAWQARAFAVRALARRCVPQREPWFASENEPRVVRAALRHRYAIDPQRLARGVDSLGRAGDLSSRLLAVELALPGADPKATSDAVEALRTIILRMNRGESGALSGRLAAITGEHDLYTPFHWKRWLSRQPRDLPLNPAFALPEPGDALPI